MSQTAGNNGNSDEPDYSHVVEELSNMFCLAMEKDAISAIVDSYDGDLINSMEAIMSLLSDGNTLANVTYPVEEPKADNSLINHSEQQPIDVPLCTSDNADPSVVHMNTHNITPSSTCESVPVPESKMSYANMSKTTGAIPKKSEPMSKIQPKPLSEQMKRIINYHKNGYKVLVIMRGPPGCGKSYLAQQIIGNTIGHGEINYKKHIFSTDDYFMRGGTYIYNRDQLSEAHEWNQNRVRSIVFQGMSPVIIDNTNIEFWETQPYVQVGVAEGYYIEVAEPKTPWAQNAYQLSKKNTHNVPFIKIKRILENFQRNVSGDELIKIIGYSYPADKVPPVLRNIPAVNLEDNVATLHSEHRKSKSQQPSAAVDNNEIESSPLVEDNESTWIGKWDDTERLDEKNNDGCSLDGPKSQRLNNKQKPSLPLLPNFQDWSKVNQKPLLPSLPEFTDWTRLDTILPKWEIPSSTVKGIEKKKTTTKTTGTCIRSSDRDIFNVNNDYKVLTGTPRDINLYYMPLDSKIPDSRKLDKSTTTNEQLIMADHKCKNVEKHFKAFRKMFKHIAAADLREIFDKCNADVNWAVEIVVNGTNCQAFDTVEQESSTDNDESENELCECTAAYEIIPQISSNTKILPETYENSVQKHNYTARRKIKKDKANISESSKEMKKQLEQNFIIPDSHYSEHCLKIKKYFHGEPDDIGNARGIIPDMSITNASSFTEFIPSRSQPDVPTLPPRVSRSSSENSDDDDDSSESAEETVTVNIGTEFVKQLDNLFGRPETTYPSDIMPLVSIPMSLVTTINALWIESLTYQLDMQANYSLIMLKEDEELARALADIDTEVQEEGREPDVIDFKQIMDMDLAMSLHQKDIANWMKTQQNDIAAKMTRAKLHNLFPEIPQETLSELLLAHDNNFQETVEGLLVSTGQESVLDTENGISKFVMTREIARQVAFLEDERRMVEADFKDWCLKLGSDEASLESIERFRQWSQQLQVKRDLCVEHANTFLKRGVREMAQRCSETAQFYSKQFEMAKNIAVTAYLRVNGNRLTVNEKTIDLHYLHVKEAIHALDIFVDENIHIARTENNKHLLTLYVVTGRGLHSDGGAKIKPAARKRLKQRGFKVKEQNPGLIYIEYSKSSPMSHEL